MSEVHKSAEDNLKRGVEAVATLATGTGLGAFFTEDAAVRWIWLAIAGIMSTVVLFSVFKGLRLVYRGPWTAYLAFAERQRLRGFIKPLVRSWLRFVAHPGPRSDDLWVIRRRLAETYFLEEVRDIKGDADWEERDNPKEGHERQPLIVTNFVNYSGQVNALIDACGQILQRHPDKVLFCFTVLSMPLVKWFNFEEADNCQHPRWTNYLRRLEKAVSDFKGNDLKAGIRARRRFMCRCLLIDDVSRTSAVLKEEARCKIWLTKDGTSHSVVPLLKTRSYQVPAQDEGRIRSGPEALPWERLTSELHKAGQVEAADYILANYPADCPAYIIVPSDKLTANFENEHGHFATLGEEFIRRYHSESKQSGVVLSLFCKPKDEYVEGDCRGGQQAMPPAPTDFFYVALASEAEIRSINTTKQLADCDLEGMFLLAGSEDASLKTIHLYLLDPDHVPGRFAWLEEHIKDLLFRGESCNKLLQ